VTRYWTDTHPDAFARGTADMCSFYGLLLGRMVMQYPNGFAYTVREPAPDDEIPARFARASEVLANKVWREQLREWDEVSKPNAIAVHRELQAIDPDTLSDAELATYVMHCRDHHARMITQHMRYTGSAVIPVGDLMAHLMAWTQVPASDVLAMMAGAAPVSAGASAELERLIAAFQGNDDARAQLAADGDPAGVLAELRARDDDVGRALDEYLDLVGCRLLDGFDIAGRYALELPDALLRAIRSAVGTGGSGADDVEARIAAVRDQVPEEHRAEFDELLGEARLMYRLRDERGVFSDIWASGLMRRAALGAGRRLAASGRVHDPEHIVDATADEMAQMVMGAGGPTADELAERFAARTAMTGREGPPFLGDPPTPPPDMAGLPPDVIRVMTATGIAIGALFGSSEAEHEENLLRGLAASGGSYEGVARRIEGPHEFDRIQQGDVLVTESTSEAFNILLPLLGAIVTDAGGLLSHSAIVAREYGIPGVVGTRDATQLIPDGARVRVDGDAGEVHVFA